MYSELRVEYPGAFYHVASRSNYQRFIFNSEEDYRKFCEIIEKAQEKFNFCIYSFCVMSTHYHLFIQTLEANLSKVIHYINSQYARYFNDLHDLSGHVFQDRYLAKLVQRELYGMKLARYIHLNPVEANIVNHPTDYAWSSYRYFFNKKFPYGFFKKDWLLSMHGSVETALSELENLTYEGYDYFNWKPNAKAYQNFFLGDQNFIMEIINKYVDDEIARKNPSIRLLRRIDRATFYLEVINKQFSGSSLTLIKKIKVYVLKTKTSLSINQIADLVGFKSRSAVSSAYSRFCKYLEKNPLLEREIEMELSEKKRQEEGAAGKCCI